MEFHALTEEWPSESIVFFRELPGCFLTAPTGANVLQAAPAAIEDYFRWLKENDIVLFEEEVRPVVVTLAERLNSSGASSGPLFTADRAAPDDLEIDKALNVAATVRALIIEQIAQIPTHLHDSVPASGGWSLTQHLQHIMENESWYVSRLHNLPEPEQSPSPMNAEMISMKIFENAMDYEIILRNLTPEQRACVFVHDNEEWTAAKVLRRMAQHLREHYAWMQDIAQQLTAQP